MYSLNMVIMAVVVACCVSGFFGSRALKISREKHTPLNLAKSADDISSSAEVLRKLMYILPFERYISRNLIQIRRLAKKRALIDEILLQKFSPDEMSYRKFCDVLDSVDHVIYLNLRSIINKISAFDYDEYKQLSQFEYNRDELVQEKLDIYETYITYVWQATNDNEEILLKLDHLQLELTDLNSLKQEDIMNMPAIVELDKLIKATKYYR